MKESIRSNSCAAIGLDVSDEYTRLCAIDESGEIVEESRLRTTSVALRKRFERLERTRIALEVGVHSPWISRLLTELGHEVLVANARKLRMIYENDRKNDRTDAQLLARMARVDPKLLSPIAHRGPQAQADLALLRGRDTLVAARTRLVNHVRGAVKSFGGRLRKISTPAFAKTVSAQIPHELVPALEPVLGAIGALNAQIRQIDRTIAALCEQRYPHTKLLRQVSGVGPVTALRYLLTLEDPWRFKKSRAVGCFLGLTCRQDQSGDRDPQLRITKAGDRALRYLLVQASHYILGPFGPDTDLRRWGLQLAQRGGKNAKKRAATAVARKLAVLLHRLWITGEVYEPLRNSTICCTQNVVNT